MKKLEQEYTLKLIEIAAQYTEEDLSGFADREWMNPVQLTESMMKHIPEESRDGFKGDVVAIFFNQA